MEHHQGYAIQLPDLFVAFRATTLRVDAAILPS
jgi:hypothetical protein